MLTATSATERLTEFLAAEIRAAQSETGRISILTPAERADGECIVVTIDPIADGRFRVSDLGDTDTALIEIAGASRVADLAKTIAPRYEVEFARGQLEATASDDQLSETVWRVAQASAALSEVARSKQRASSARDRLDSEVARELKMRSVAVEVGHPVFGASGHQHQASLFVPSTETIIETIGGEKAWNSASALYAKFGDLGEVNGYQFLAVIDDRDGSVKGEVAALLGQVAEVGRWSARSTWIEKFTPA